MKPKDAHGFGAKFVTRLLPPTLNDDERDNNFLELSSNQNAVPLVLMIYLLLYEQSVK